jgi:hypothetical protein
MTLALGYKTTLMLLAGAPLEVVPITLPKLYSAIVPAPCLHERLVRVSWSA